MAKKYPKFTISARLSWLALLIGTVLEVIASFIPIAVMKNMLRYVAYGAGFLIAALIYYKQKEKKPVILASIVAMLVVGTISANVGSFGAEIYNWIRWGSIDVYYKIYGGYGLIFSLIASLYTCLGIFYLLAAWFDGTFRVVMTRVALLALAAVVIFVIVSAVMSGNGASSDKGDNSGGLSCFNCGGDGWDSNNNCRCVWCGGEGKTIWNP